MTFTPMRFPFPDPVAYVFSNATVGGATRMAVSLRAPASGDVDRVLFRVGTVTTAATLRVRLESVSDIDHRTTGNLLATGAAGTVTSPVSNTVYGVSIATPPNVTTGGAFAIVIDTNGVAGNIGISRLNGHPLLANPYLTRWDGSLWAAGTGVVAVGAVSIGGVWRAMPGMWPLSDCAIASFSTNSSPNERGNLITAPADMTVAGVHWSPAETTATGPFEFRLYDSSGGLLASASAPGGQMIPTNAFPASHLFTAPVDLTKGESYRITVRPTSGTNIQIRNYAWPSDYAAALPFIAFNPRRTTRSGTGAWTDTADAAEGIGLLVSAISDSAAGQGGNLKYYDGAAWQSAASG
jgi:hypothetical protein